MASTLPSDVSRVWRGRRPPKASRGPNTNRIKSDRGAKEKFDEAQGFVQRGAFSLLACGPWRQRAKVQRVLDAALEVLERKEPDR